jgi:hypothetical protein
MWCGRPGRLGPGRSVAKAHRKLLLDRFCQQAAQGSRIDDVEAEQGGAHEFHGAWDGETGSRRCLHPPTGACSAADRARSTVQKQPSSSGPAGLHVIRSEHCDPRAIQKLEHPCPASAAALRTVMQGRVRSKAGPGLQPVKSSVPSSAAGDRRHNASPRLADWTAQGEAPPISFLLRWCAGAQHRQKRQHRLQRHQLRPGTPSTDHSLASGGGSGCQHLA